MFAITIGEGRQRPQGRRFPVGPPPVEGLCKALKAQPARVERYWSVHLWERDYRLQKGWIASIGVAVDLDYRIPNEPPSPDVAARLAEAARTGRLPGSIFHLTPHGARLVFVYELACTHRGMQVSASKGAAALVERALADLDLFDYVVDPCTWDLARFYYTPNSVAKGVARTDEVVLMRPQPFEVDALAAEEPTPIEDIEPQPAPTTRRVVSMDESIRSIVERWNADHRADYPTRPGTCPACQHNDCFHALPKDTSKWFCFSSGHSGVGIQSADSAGHYGDALDLEAFARGCKTIDVLRADGYLSAPRRPPPRAAVNAPEPAPEPEPEVIPIASPSQTFRPWRSRSYLTAVELLRKNARDILEGRQLEMNEMSGRPELGRQPIRDSDVSRIRGLVESRFSGGLDKNNNEVGMVLGREDLRDAVDQVAAENPYHPVRHYLRTLAWDGVERIAAIPEDVLGSKRTELSQAMMRRWFISAVARALSAGCKVDTVLILVGLQGVRKSTFFKTLADPWFIDSSVDIHNKDSFQVLRGAWLYEWAELEVLKRARDATAAKAFLSSAIDTYRPSHARYVVDVPRSCVIVGSTNERDFLTDATGNRRFWPLDAQKVDIELLASQRDQLWAEAVARYDRGEQWWFDAGETAALEYLHEHYHAADAWDDAVLAYDGVDFTTGDVLRFALKKEIGNWSKPDEMRVARILRRNGWEQVKLTGRRVWRKR